MNIIHIIILSSTPNLPITNDNTFNRLHFVAGSLCCLLLRCLFMIFCFAVDVYGSKYSAKKPKLCWNNNDCCFIERKKEKKKTQTKIRAFSFVQFRKFFFLIKKKMCLYVRNHYDFTEFVDLLVRRNVSSNSTSDTQSHSYIIYNAPPTRTEL